MGRGGEIESYNGVHLRVLSTDEKRPHVLMSFLTADGGDTVSCLMPRVHADKN